MELQQRSFSCGASAVRAALYLLGHNVQESTVRKWANTTPQDGTDEKGIVRALHHYEYGTRELQETSVRRAWGWLKSQLEKGRPVLICVDGWSHWTTAIGIFGGRVMVFDPERIPGKRKKYSGLQLYTEQEFAKRWCYMEDGVACYYAIVVSF